MNRQAFLEQLEATPTNWDVLVIGGGATGLGVAVEAASRGYRTVLLEQGDFAQATSSRSTKLIHGGVRYLQQGNLALVRESLRERGRLLRNAPHLVRAVPFVLPNYRWWERSFYGAGLELYDWLAGDLGLGSTQHLSRQQVFERIPTIAGEGLRGGILYHDAQFDDARLALTLAKTCAARGGLTLNYVQVTRFLRSGHRVAGVVARDVEEGREFEVRGQVVINATGVFTDELRKRDDGEAARLLALSQGAHVVLPKSFLPGNCALMSPHTEDGRVFFAIPWLDRTVIGTTETPVASPTLEPQPRPEEIHFLLAQAGRHLARKPAASDVLSVFAGLRPLVRNGGAGEETAGLSRGHRIFVSSSGLVTITGGKWTTYRQMAEDTVDQAAVVGGLPLVKSRTPELKLLGATDATEVPDGSSLPAFPVYGSEAGAVRELCQLVARGTELLHLRLPYRVGEVIWAVRHEMARTVADVLARRLRALFLDAKTAMEVAPRVAALMAPELGQSHDWEQSQVAAFQELAAGYLVP